MSRSEVALAVSASSTPLRQPLHHSHRDGRSAWPPQRQACHRPALRGCKAEYRLGPEFPGKRIEASSSSPAFTIDSLCPPAFSQRAEQVSRLQGFMHLLKARPAYPAPFYPPVWVLI
ncbi:hypothetical protein LIA77_01964 [Sarocladium implicatum]|nr:hypothetical protein LIA77_01964 [Sarocladium implicatum]